MGILQSHVQDVIVLRGMLPQNQSRECNISGNIFPKLIPKMGIFLTFSGICFLTLY